MADPNLRDLEREVETARAKLAEDLSTLSSPRTYSQFTELLKQEALEAKDALVEKAKSSAKSTVETLVEDLKAKAAANPSAVLAIGAGIAWRFIRHPPIATALVTAGLISLLRAPASGGNGRSTRDYFDEAKERLGEQTRAFAGEVKDRVVDAAGATSDRVTEIADVAKDRIQEWGSQITSAAQDTAGQIGDKAASSARIAGQKVTEKVAALQPQATERDSLLLGIAGVAVVAALGVAYQRRSSDSNI